MMIFNLMRIQKTYCNSFNLKRKAISYSISKMNAGSLFSFCKYCAKNLFIVRVIKSKHNNSFSGKY